MIVSRSQMVAAEEAVFARGVRAEDLMESAGRQIAACVRQFHRSPGRCVVFAGKGHNGGDVFVAARHLAAHGWTIAVEDVFPHADLAPLTALERNRLNPSEETSDGRPLVVLDGLLGIGATGAPREPVASAIRKINTLRAEQSAWVLAADVPSGLDADTGIPAGLCVRADVTMTMGFAKSGLLADTATGFVGRIAIAALPEIAPPAGANPATVLSPVSLAGLLPPRPFDIHKGLCGRVGILAGSSGYTGAARLCSEAAVLAGAGLITLLIPRDIYPVLAAAAIPEVMVQPVDSLTEVLHGKFDVIALGPGLGASHRQEILEVIRSAACPCVVDADALNALSTGHLDLLAPPAGPLLLTPHPGEMQRLFPEQNRSREKWLADFVTRYPVTLLLKGSRTVIGDASHPPAYNSTGHPGMASGGMGDILTGVCAALMAQNKSPRDAAMLGAWVCGHAAEIAIADGASQESLRASDVAANLGHAFNALRAGVF